MGLYLHILMQLNYTNSKNSTAKKENKAITTSYYDTGKVEGENINGYQIGQGNRRGNEY
jgi:hypothetical protein